VRTPDDRAAAPHLTRRRLLAAGAGVGAAAAAGALIRQGDGAGDELAPRNMPRAAAGLPAGQHEWEARLEADAHGNAVAPPHQRLLLFDLAGAPTAAGATWIEAALRRIDALRPAVFTALGWSAEWFALAGLPSPIPKARALNPAEAPNLDGAICCLHLAAADEQLLEAVDAALTRGAALPGGTAGEADVRPVLRLVERRGGFIGAGLPAGHTRDLTTRGGVEVPQASPLFMGFPSGMRRNQATEAAVTIDHGRWRGGSTMHVSRIALTLPSWYATLTDQQRTARMHGPGVSARAALDPGSGLEPATADLGATARRYGVVGHAQAAATARRREKPIILRRDFNGVERGQPMTHFVALARTIEDFEATRKAMDAARAQAASESVGAQVNNGINEWLSVHDRANFLVPPRAMRAFPGLPGSGAPA
jgi:hypothetical protein